MIFPVGSSRYQLRIAPGEIKLDGRPVDAATVETVREVLIGVHVPQQSRRHLLLRELARAWVFETGEPKDREGWFDLAATMAGAAMDSLDLCGGVHALLSLAPGDSPQAGAVRQGLSTGRECGRCKGTVAGGSVAWRPSGLPGVAELRIYCDFCGVTQVWREMVNAKGVPTNRPLGEPKYEPGDTTGLALSAV